MAEVKKSVVAKATEVKKEEVKVEAKAAAPVAEKKAEVKVEAKAAAPAKKEAAPKAAAKKAPAKKEAAPKAAAKKAPAKKEAAPKAAAKKAPAKKEAAPKTAAKETLAIQFAGKDYSSEAIMKLVKESYKATKNKAAIKTLNVYVNVDDSRAYYVVNNEFHGSAQI